jgi:riboflavin synthase
MFTGIVASIGRLDDAAGGAGAPRFTVDAGGLATGGWKCGDSISVAGVCLTIERLDGQRFGVAVSPETLARTTLGRLAAGDAVNLEPALRAGEPLGGHLVTGHVDGVARVTAREEQGGALVLAFAAPAELSRFIAPRGSVALDGVSLTVNEAAGADFRVTVIPHTQRVTTLGRLRPGDRVNLEVDLVARYLARLLPGPERA